MQKKGREVASCLFHNLSPFICTCSRCRFFMLEVAAKTASRYFFPKIARYRFSIRGLGVYELCLYPIKAFFDCEAPPGDVFWKIDKVFSYMRAARYRSCITMWTSRNLVLWGRPRVDGNGFKDGKVAFLQKKKHSAFYEPGLTWLKIHFQIIFLVQRSQAIWITGWKFTANRSLHRTPSTDIAQILKSMLQNAVPAKIVSAMLGHSSIGITMDTYSHVLTDMQEGSTSKMNTLLKKLY